MSNGHRTPWKEKQWGFLPSIELTLTGNGTFQGGSISFTSKQTVLRMLGEIVIAPTTAPTAFDSANITIGIGKVSTDAFEAGAGSMPDSNGEPDYPWLFWKDYGFFFGASSVDPASWSGMTRDTFDIRTMRKFGPRESLAYVVTYSNVTGDPPLTVKLQRVRVLTTIH